MSGAQKSTQLSNQLRELGDQVDELDEERAEAEHVLMIGISPQI